MNLMAFATMVYEVWRGGAGKIAGTVLRAKVVTLNCKSHRGFSAENSHLKNSHFSLKNIVKGAVKSN